MSLHQPLGQNEKNRHSAVARHKASQPPMFPPRLRLTSESAKPARILASPQKSDPVETRVHLGPKGVGAVGGGTAVVRILHSMQPEQPTQLHRSAHGCDFSPQ